MKIIGITKVRNEAHIIQDTLDSWGQVCDSIHVYDDCSIDDTARIAVKHPKVMEVISSNLFDHDRERAEWFCRQAVWLSAKRFLENDDWVAYFDGDEHIYDFSVETLEDPDLMIVACPSYDAYITEEDAYIDEWHYSDREPWVSPEHEQTMMFYRNRPWLGFHLPDQRNMVVSQATQQFIAPEQVALAGKMLHWSKGISIENWERKCHYYTKVFGPKYAAKWEARKGKAIHTHSDFGNPLVKWSDVRIGAVETINRRGMALVS